MNKIQNITYKRISVNGLYLNVAFSGPQNGEPIILLHGFPDASFGWNRQITALGEQNFYVIAPDQRGYNLSDKPKGRDNYRMNLLVSDIISLADFLELEQFNLVGHDFGAMVCWYLMEHHSHRVKHLTIINVPHPLVMERYLKENKEQRKRSWYAFFFRIPVLPEIMMRITNFNLLSNAMKHSFSKEQIQEYKKAWKQPGAITAMVNWYRCLFKLETDEKPKSIITTPTLIIWGKQDPHLMWEMAADSAKMCEDARVAYLENATHWVMEDEPERTNALLINFLTREEE